MKQDGYELVCEAIVLEGEKWDRFRDFYKKPADLKKLSGEKILGWVGCRWTKNLKNFATKHLLNPDIFSDNSGTVFVTNKRIAFVPKRAALQSQKNFEKKFIPKDIPLSDIERVRHGKGGATWRAINGSGYDIDTKSGERVNFIAAGIEQMKQFDAALQKSGIKVEMTVIRSLLM